MKLLFESERLNICLAEKENITAIMDIEQDEENRKFVWQGTYEEHFEEIGDTKSLLLTLNEKNTDALVGFMLAVVDKKSEVFELKRIVVSDKGRGYGKETLHAVMEYSFNTLHSNRFWLDVYPDNEVGINLYKSLGMKHEGTLRQAYKRGDFYMDQMVFSILRGEYLHSRKL